MANGKVVIYAENRIKEGLESAKKDILGFGDAADNVGKTLTKALTVTAIAAGLKKLGEEAFKCFKEFGEDERRTNQLKIALDATGGSFKKNSELIEQLSKKTLSSKDDVEGLVAELASLGKSDSDIKKISQAAVNLSNVTGQNLNAAFTQVNATFSGTAGKLEKLIPELGSLTKEQLSNGAAADLINKNLGALSDRLTKDDIPQKLKNISDSWGDLRENLGKAVAPIFSPIIEGINQVIESWNNAMIAADNYHKISSKSTGYDEKLAALNKNLELENKRLAVMKATPNYQNNKMSPLELQLVASQEGKIATLEDAIKQLKKSGDSTVIKSLLAKSDLVSTNNYSPYNQQQQEALDKFSKDVKTALAEGDFEKLYAYWNNSNIDKLPDLLTAIKNYFSDAASNQFKSIASDGINEEVNFRETNTETPKSYLLTDSEQLDKDVKNALYKENQDWFIQAGKIFGNSFSTSLKADGTLKELLSINVDKNYKPLDMNKWAPTTTGDYSAKGYKFNFDEYNMFKDYVPQKPKEIIDNTLDTEVKVQLMTENQNWFIQAGKIFGNSFSTSLNVDNPQIKELLGVTVNKYYKPLDMEKWAPTTTGDYSAKGYKFNADNYNYFGDNYDELVKLNSSIDEAIKGGDGETLMNALNNSKLGLLPNAFDKINEYFKQAAEGQFNDIKLNGADVSATNAELLKVDNKKLLEEMIAEYKILGGSQGQSGVSPSIIGGNGLNAAGQVEALKITNSIFKNISQTFQGVAIDVKSAASNVFSKDAFTSSGLSGSDILDSLTGSFGTLFTAIQPLTQIIFSSNPLLAALLPIIEGAVSILAPAITEVIEPLMNTLTMLGETIGIAILPILDAISPVFAIIANILQAVLLPVIQLLAPIITIVASVFDLLTPILKLFAKAITIVMAPIEFLGDLFTWVATAIKNAVHNLVEFIEHPFNANNRDTWTTEAFSSDAFSTLAERLAAIDNIGQTNLTGSTTTSTGYSSGSSAAYTGGNTVTINIYQSGAVVGSNGMTELAQMIRNEFAVLGYYNM